MRDMQFVCIQMFEIHVATVYFQAIVPTLFIMTKENNTATIPR